MVKLSEKPGYEKLALVGGTLETILNVFVDETVPAIVTALEFVTVAVGLVMIGAAGATVSTVIDWLQSAPVYSF